MNFELYRQLERRKCRDSFWYFLLSGFGAKYNPKGVRWLDEQIHKPMCDWFEGHVKAWIEARKHGKGYPLYLMVLVPRDVGKTTTISQAGLLWMHLLDPDISTYIGSERTEFAIDVLEPIKNVMAGNDVYSRFSWLYGNWNAPERTWSQKQVVHAARTNLSRKEPSFGIWGVESGITGKHPDVLCLDDPTSYEKMAAVGNWLSVVNSHVDSLIPVLPSDGCLIFVGTRYHDGDHFGVGLKKEGLRSISGMDMPNASPVPDGKWHCYFLSARDANGVPSVPSVWPESRLMDFKRKSPLRYAAQVLNDPMNSELNELNPERLARYTLPPEQIPKNLRITLHLDTAFKSNEQKARGDYSVIVEMGHTIDGSGIVYFLGAHASNSWGYEDFRDMLISRYQFWRSQGKRVTLITDEALIGKGMDMWKQVLQGWFHAIDVPMPPLAILSRAGKKKISRHHDASQFILDSKVYFNQEAKGLDMLFDQLSKIGGSEYDDHIDAFSDAFHPECYNVMHRLGMQTKPDEPIKYPWDDYLKMPVDDYLRRDAERAIGGY